MIDTPRNKTRGKLFWENLFGYLFITLVFTFAIVFMALPRPGEPGYVKDVTEQLTLNIAVWYGLGCLVLFLLLSYAREHAQRLHNAYWGRYRVLDNTIDFPNRKKKYLNLVQKITFIEATEQDLEQVKDSNEYIDNLRIVKLERSAARLKLAVHLAKQLQEGKLKEKDLEKKYTRHITDLIKGKNLKEIQESDAEKKAQKKPEKPAEGKPLEKPPTLKDLQDQANAAEGALNKAVAEEKQRIPQGAKTIKFLIDLVEADKDPQGKPYLSILVYAAYMPEAAFDFAESVENIHDFPTPVQMTTCRMSWIDDGTNEMIITKLTSCDGDAKEGLKLHLDAARYDQDVKEALARVIQLKNAILSGPDSIIRNYKVQANFSRQLLDQLVTAFEKGYLPPDKFKEYVQNVALGKMQERKKRNNVLGAVLAIVGIAGLIIWVVLSGGAGAAGAAAAAGAIVK